MFGVSQREREQAAESASVAWSLGFWPPSNVIPALARAGLFQKLRVDSGTWGE